MEYLWSFFSEPKQSFLKDEGKTLRVPENHFKTEEEVEKFSETFQKKVENIEILSNGLKNSKYLMKLFHKNLKKLDLSNNQLKEFSSFELLNLEYLLLNNNQLETIENVDKNFPNLVRLEIRSNKLKTIEKSNIWNLLKLKTLYLDENELKTLPEELISLSNFTLSVQENSIDLKHLPKCLIHEWKGVIKLWHLQRVPQEILEGVYLGPIQAAKNKDFLKENNFTHVLTVNIMEKLFPESFEYLIVKEEDEPNANLLQHLDNCFEFIEDAKKKGGNVLVHCAAGQSRSASVVIAYVMKTMKMNFKDAYQHVWNSRCCLFVNSGFVKQLELFSNIGCEYEGDAFESHLKNEIKNSTNHLELSMLRLNEFNGNVSENLTHLNLSYNNLSALGGIHYLIHLKELNLSHNQFKEISSDIGELSNLEDLNLSHNKLSLLNSKIFNLKKLKKLDVSKNEISCIPDSIDFLENLEILILKNNLLKDLKIELKSLRVLDLTFNRFLKNPFEGRKLICYFHEITQNVNS
jgi:Leucine-rich repeat (LRR) protein